MAQDIVASERGRLESVADDLWIVDAEPISAAGVPIPLRMTVIRLASGDILLHSPVKYSSELHADIERIGRIRYLMAPNIAHWMFLRDWQSALPQAATFAVPGLASRSQVRKAGVQVDHEFGDATPVEWADDVETVLIEAPLFAEAALFHKATRTLILTDLVQNFRPEELPPLARVGGNLLGVTAPDGKAPLYLRALLRLGGDRVREAAGLLIAFEPERVIFAHGDWFRHGGAEKLRRSLRWLVKTGESIADRKRARELDGVRVVITGASSGIGRAAALAFARKGANIVLAARREDVLERVAGECRKLGAQAVCVATDVTDPTAMLTLATRADESFGGIDVWINNAGTGVFGPYQDADIALHRQTIEVNLLGAMHGSYAVLPVFLRQNGGVLINNISLGGWAPTPFAAAYTASKFGLRGFTASLRQEVAAHANIHVCGVFPAMIDTPGFVHGANVSGRTLDPGPFLYRPEDVADTFVRLVRNPRDEVAVGWPARAGQLSYMLARKPTERLTGAAFRRLLSCANPARRTEGALLRTIPEGTSSSGGWLARKHLPSAGQITKMAVLTLGVGGGLLLGLGMLRARPARLRGSARRS